MAELLILQVPTLTTIVTNHFLDIVTRQIIHKVVHTAGPTIIIILETVIVITPTAQIVVDLIAEILVEIIVQPLRYLIV